MPGSKQFMLKHAGRNIARRLPPTDLLERGAEQEALIERHEDGLAAYRVHVGPGESIPGPNGHGGGGQFYILCDGRLIHEGRELDPFSLAWVGPEEPPPTLAASARGAHVLVVQFPAAPEAEAEGLAFEAGKAKVEEGEGPQVIERRVI
jgi:hypothetical protein